MSISFFNYGIRSRLLGGFSLVCTLRAATVGCTAYAVSDINTRLVQVVELRTPVAIASTQLVGNLYSTLSTLRGYLLTGDPEGKKSRAAMWVELDRTAADFDRMEARFTNPDNKARWKRNP
jgi:methyl-accepting chemotaxis protein